MATRARFQEPAEHGPPRKKRKLTGRSKKAQLEVVAPHATLDGLPDNIVLFVMTLLDKTSLVRLSRVCRRFHHLYSDESVWSSVDLTRESICFKLDSRKLKNIILTHFPASVHEVKLSSNANHFVSKNPVVTEALLNDLLTRCPHIQRLTLKDCDVTNFSSDCKLYSCESFTHVAIVDTRTTLRWMQTVKPSWPNLTHLSLEKTVMITDDDLRYIGGCEEWRKNLRSLNLRGCYRITGPVLIEVCMLLKNLKTLDVRYCSIKLTDTLLESENYDKLKCITKLLYTSDSVGTLY